MGRNLWNWEWIGDAGSENCAWQEGEDGEGDGDGDRDDDAGEWEFVRWIGFLAGVECSRRLVYFFSLGIWILKISVTSSLNETLHRSRRDRRE